MKSERRTSSTPIATKSRKNGLASGIATGLVDAKAIRGDGVPMPARVERGNGALGELRSVDLGEAEGAPRRRGVGHGVQHVDVERALQHAEVAAHPDREPAVLGLQPRARARAESRT